MRRVIVSLGFALIAAGGVSFSVVPSAAPRKASNQSVFLLPPSDGYGIADCIAQNRECGKIVANAWCESKGFAKAASYALVSATETTGSIGGRGAAAASEPPVMAQPLTHSEHFGAASLPQGMIGTVEVEFLGEPSISLSE
jgi:hypothetical protein